MSVDKLVEAAREGQAEELRELLAAGTPVDGVNAEGVDALTMAAAWGHVDLVDALIEAGAAPNGSRGSRNPLSAACTMRQVASVRRLLEHGADPNAGERPRFMVVDVLAEEVSADPGNLLTPAEPLSHRLVGDQVVSSIGRFEDGNEVTVFESSFPAADPETNEVARFTREMAIGNDYIYWAHGVSDRVLYNATTFNHDAYFIDPADITYTDTSRWAQYLKPEIKDAVYYVNSLEYTASPMANLLTSEHLDITPEWRDELAGFKNNGHQAGLMRKAAERIPAQRLWVNPDCGLKTRQWDEVMPALRNMVAAANDLRRSIPLTNRAAS